MTDPALDKLHTPQAPSLCSEPLVPPSRDSITMIGTRDRAELEGRYSDMIRERLGLEPGQKVPARQEIGRAHV
jgi:hypothetical protein